MRPQTAALRLETKREARFHDFQPGFDDFLSAALEGLSRPSKALPCRFLYDEAGSALFEQICELPEYYPTRTETKILRDNAATIAAALGRGVQLIELGSGASTKVRILLDALNEPCGYVPIDISGAQLKMAADAVQEDYPDLEVDAVCADYSQAFELPPSAGRRVGFYPGSTIGNLTPAAAMKFLALWAERLGKGSSLLVGIDLRKDAERLEAAYDDAQGVTAAFSRNLLARANRELDADFDLSAFIHEARYDEGSGRVAIHLRSLREQQAGIGGRTLRFARGERIHIEDSWKYTVEGFQALARSAGYRPSRCWTDSESLFSVHLLDI